ncbi:uncharacterized protein CBL_11676 [Carabus blaptoides fortunei]
MYTPAVIVSGTDFGRTSQIIRCPTCHNMVLTKMRSSVNPNTHIFALILCGLGCWPCALIPYCIRSCQDIDHYCPICETYLGSN